MAASSTMCCASLRREPITLICGAGLTLALLACAPENKDHDQAPASGPSIPHGFELASVAAAPMDSGAKVIDLSPDMLSTKLHGRAVRLIDIRTDAEVATGIIPGAEHIPMDAFDASTLDPADERAVILYCRSGRRSRILGQRLSEATGTASVHLGGGILAWAEAGYPVVTP